MIRRLYRKMSIMMHLNKDNQSYMKKNDSLYWSEVLFYDELLGEQLYNMV